ncbi:MAG: arginase family protein [Steroidobacteraceae bacterium]|nr:arginase family protein [Steroidobacteraceae bacterium]
MRTGLIIYRGGAGDRNARGLAGAQLVGNELSSRLHQTPVLVGTPSEPRRTSWDRELALARGDLRSLAVALDGLLGEGMRVVTAMGRCAAGLATIPVIAVRQPDACVVWLDAHGDSNLPTSHADPYLGGMVISGAAGLWDSGLGGGLDLTKVLLVGARDLDPDEQRLIAEGKLRHLPVCPDLPARLREAIAGRAVYVHLDCDVLDPGIVPTEYAVAGGLTLEDLRAVAEVVAEHPVVGVEIAEFESHFADGRPGNAAPLIDALAPLLGGAAE